MRTPTIAEELLVLAYNPDSSGLPKDGDDRLNTGLVGAMLADLALSGHITISNDRVHARHTAPTGDPNLDHLAHKVAAERRPRKVGWWVEKFRSGRMAKALIGHAVAHGVLRQETGRRLGFTVSYYHPARPGHREDLLRRLRDVLNANGDTADARMGALFKLDHAMRMRHSVFSKARTTLLGEDSERTRILDDGGNRLLARGHDKKLLQLVQDATRNDPIAEAVRSALAPKSPPGPP